MAHAKGMVNAVLRRFLRERDGAGGEAGCSSRSPQWNYPQWWIDAAKAAYPRQLAARSSRPATRSRR